MGRIKISSPDPHISGFAYLELLHPVRKITVSDLDDGSSNNGTGGSQKGLVYGKMYHLEATRKGGSVPADKDIRWECEFTDENGQTHPVTGWKPTGKKVTFTIKKTDWLGGTLTFYAYNVNKQVEARLQVWAHYRFRHFDRQVLKQEIQVRKGMPKVDEDITFHSQVDQANTSLCGMACVFYLFARNEPEEYIKYILDLHKNGTATHRDYTCRPSDSMYNFDPATKNMGGMKYMDWMSMAVTRNAESTFNTYTGEASQEFGSVNWPPIMEKLAKELLGYSVEKGIIRMVKPNFKDRAVQTKMLRQLSAIDQERKQGCEIWMMVDGDMLNDVSKTGIEDFGQYHWIAYEGDLKLFNLKGNDLKWTLDADLDAITGAGYHAVPSYDDVKRISFKVFSWGAMGDLKISRESYINNFYDYIKLRKK